MWHCFRPFMVEGHCSFYGTLWGMGLCVVCVGVYVCMLCMMYVCWGVWECGVYLVCVGAVCVGVCTHAHVQSFSMVTSEPW